jgi:hypothetical protein
MIVIIQNAELEMLRFHYVGINDSRIFRGTIQAFACRNRRKPQIARIRGSILIAKPTNSDSVTCLSAPYQLSK